MFPNLMGCGPICTQANWKSTNVSHFNSKVLLKCTCHLFPKSCAILNDPSWLPNAVYSHKRVKLKGGRFQLYCIKVMGPCMYIVGKVIHSPCKLPLYLPSSKYFSIHKRNSKLNISSRGEKINWEQTTLKSFGFYCPQVSFTETFSIVIHK